MVCSFGFSTSMIMQRMTTAAAEQGEEYEIAAYSMEEIFLHGNEADIIMIAPQVRFSENKLKAAFPDKAIVVIDMRPYGMMDGKSILATAKEAMGIA